MERKKGKVEVGLGSENDSIFAQSPHQNKIAANTSLVAICYGKNKIVHAKHLTICWNAFEDGGLVDKLMGALENLVRGQLQHPTFEGYVRHAVWVAEEAIAEAKGKE